MKEHTFYDDPEAYECAIQNANEICACANLRKNNDFRACAFCQMRYKSDPNRCLCGGIGCVNCCGPS